PHLTTIAAFDGAVDMYRDWMYHGGIPTLGFAEVWGMTVVRQHQAEGHDPLGGDRYRMPADVAAHPLDGAWHKTRAPFWELDQVDIPVLSVGCWGKGGLHLRGNVLGYQRVRGPKQLLIAHADSFPAAQRLFEDREFHERELLPWYDYHLKGIQNGVMDRPPVRLFVEREGQYHAAQTWPPEDAAPSAFYLSGAQSGVVTSLNDGSLTEQAPTAQADSVSWSYPDPRWLAGNVTFNEHGVPDPIARILTFTSAPFERDREFTGDGVLVLHASTDQTVLDVIAKVSVLAPGPRGPLRRR